MKRLKHAAESLHGELVQLRDSLDEALTRWANNAAD